MASLFERLVRVLLVPLTGRIADTSEFTRESEVEFSICLYYQVTQDSVTAGHSTQWFVQSQYTIPSEWAMITC